MAFLEQGNYHTQTFISVSCSPLATVYKARQMQLFKQQSMFNITVTKSSVLWYYYEMGQLYRKLHILFTVAFTFDCQSQSDLLFKFASNAIILIDLTI